MNIWDYRIHVIVYVSATAVATCDDIIRFYVINLLSGAPYKVKCLRIKYHLIRTIEVKWSWYHLDYCLVQCCNFREGQHTPRMDGSFTLPHCSNHRIYRRINDKEKYHDRRYHVAHESYPMVGYILKM